MLIDPFGIEMWMNEFEDHCDYNLAETCIKPMSINDLLELSGTNINFYQEISTMTMSYGAIEGTDRLRTLIASLFQKKEKQNVLISHGAIGANSLVYNALISPGDSVTSIMPTYQQHYSIPESLGAEIKIVQLKAENNFLPDLNELKNSLSSKTKLISLTNPNNPTGSVINEDLLARIVELAISHDAYILCDEVYRGTNQSGPEYTVSIADLYDKGISTGSMSKTYSLAGLRLGWIVSSREILKMIFRHRDYNTISVGMINDYCASIALANRERISKRNIPIIRGNLRILDDWVKKEKRFSYIKPKGGTTALLKYDYDIPSRIFCIDILKNTGVLFAPGSALNMEGWIRIGYANDPEILKTGIEAVSKYLPSLESY